MVNYREILRLKSLRYSNSDIASSVHSSRNTVQEVLNIARAMQISWPLDNDVTNGDLRDLLYPDRGAADEKRMIPDYPKIHRELAKKGVTLTLLWTEYCLEAHAAGKIPYMSTQFGDKYRKWARATKATMRITHKPGDSMEVDWAGSTLNITDPVTGEVRPAYLFVAVLSCSLYTYAEVCPDMKEGTFIACHVHAYEFFDGVTRLLIPDNLKTGVDKHGRNEIKLNRAYSELAEHYNTAILPCRVRSPKDKAMVEGTVGIISTFILAALRNRRFLSLAELNEAISEKLYEFNHKPFQKREGSRAIAFEEERAFLMPLPPRPYELAVWKIATVAPNYHISIDKMNYSVPYEYIKKKVDVRLTRMTVEVFYDGDRICSHRRLYGRANQYSTNEEHMPDDHQKYIQWNGERFIHWAAKIGNNTKAVVSAILSGYKVEQQGYKACMGLLKLADKHTPDRLENACKRALSFTPRPSYKNIQVILSSGQDRQDEVVAEKPDNTEQYGFTRGGSYYGGVK